MTGKSKHQHSRSFRSVAVGIGLLVSRKLGLRIRRPPTRELSYATTLFAYVLLLCALTCVRWQGTGPTAPVFSPGVASTLCKETRFLTASWTDSSLLKQEPVNLSCSGLSFHFLHWMRWNRECFVEVVTLLALHALRLDMLRLFQAFIKPT